MGLRPEATVQATTTTNIKLSTKDEMTLRRELKLWEEKKARIKVYEAECDLHKQAIEEVRDRTGEQSIEFEGYTVTYVTPIRNVLDKKKLVKLGCKMEWIEKAMVPTPSKAYTKVTAPGED